MPNRTPTTIPFREPNLPEPLYTWTNQSRNTAGWTTAVARLFGPDVDYCGRCPRERCSLVMGTCLVLVQGYVSDDDAPDLNTHHLPWRDPSAPDLGGGCDHGRLSGNGG